MPGTHGRAVLLYALGIACNCKRRWNLGSSCQRSPCFCMSCHLLLLLPGIGHSLLSYSSTLRGISKLQLDQERLHQVSHDTTHTHTHTAPGEPTAEWCLKPCQTMSLQIRAPWCSSRPGCNWQTCTVDAIDVWCLLRQAANSYDCHTHSYSPTPLHMNTHSAQDLDSSWEVTIT
jgi:hypothetical protein